MRLQGQGIERGYFLVDVDFFGTGGRQLETLAVEVLEEGEFPAKRVRSVNPKEATYT